MAYHVIKKIHGKKYLYAQRSYREGGTVRTESRYIGLVDDDGVIIETPTASGLSQPEGLNRAFSGSSVSKGKKSGAKAGEKSQNLTLQKITLKCDLSFFRMSESAFVAEHQKIMEGLLALGIASEKIPSLLVKYGKEVQHFKKAFSKNFVVCVPKKKGVRESFRKECRKALYRMFIETLEQEKPECVAPFLSVFDESFRATQKALFTYMASTNSKEKFVRSLALQYFSVLQPIPTGKKSVLPPEKLGLVSYGKRKDWKDEFCELMAEIKRSGWERLRSRANLEITKASRSQKKAIGQKTIFFLRRRKTIKRLQARIDANRELVHKLMLLRPLVENEGG